MVRDLEEVAEGLGSFSVETADGETELVDRLNHLVDLLAEDETRKMKHGGGAHPGADVGGAGGEVAEGGGEGVLEFFF